MSFDKLLGSFLGLAIGDAVGTTLEFKVRDSYVHLTDMVGGGPFNLPVGYWTDDTSMAICLAKSLIHAPKLNKYDLLNRFFDWYADGVNSSTGKCFDIGNGTLNALLDYNNTLQVEHNHENYVSGNGSIMRLAPAFIANSNNLRQAIYIAQEQSKTTHSSRICLDACDLLTRILFNCLKFNDKNKILDDIDRTPYTHEIQHIFNNLHVTRHEVESSGYVVHTLHAAIWCVLQTYSFKEAVLLAANLGDDADTVAAVTGQIAGTLYGANSFPEEWKEKILDHDRFIQLTEALIETK